MNFEQLALDPRVLAGVKAAGYDIPTPIQLQAIPVVMGGRDVLGLAQTGTGKTAAFMLPIINRLLTGKTGQVRALILAPTRELAEQIRETAIVLSQKTKLRTIAVYGGVSRVRQISDLRRGADIVVACPGRLLDLMGERVIDLSKVEVLVLDEADRMCDMGFLPDIRRILRQLPSQRQTLFFSATMPDDIRGLADEILNNPFTVQVDVIAPAKTVSHALYPVLEGHKTKLLLAMLEKVATGRVLVFTRTKRRARNLALDLQQNNYRVAALQGNMAQNQRQQAINGFREGKYDILVATDIAARGIDVSEISHVINFDMPDTVDAYTHRIGRTGRAEQTGEAFTFSMPADEPAVRDIERVLGGSIERRRLPDFDYGSFSPENRPQAAQVRTGAGRPGQGAGGRNFRRGPASGNSQPQRYSNTRQPAAAGSSSARRQPQRSSGSSAR